MMRLNTRAAVGCLSAAIALTLAGCPGGSNPPGNDAGTDDANVMRPDAFMGSATFTMTPATQNFGDVVVGQTSTASMFTVTNTGSAASSAVTVAISGGNASDFSIGANTCTGTLAPAATCTVSVTFAPPSAASPHMASAMLTASAGTATASSALSGRAVADVGFTVTPTPFSFGTTAVGTPTASHTFTVTNTGGVPSGTLTASLTGLDATQFTLGTDGCTGMVLAGGATCDIDVTYSPTSAGDHGGTLSVSASPGGTANAALSGRAQVPAAITVVPGSRNFGSVVQGQMSSTVDFTVRNTGGVATANVAVTITGTDASEFSVVSDLCSGSPLAGGATCTITVQYTAGSVNGAKTATLAVSAGSLSASAMLLATSTPLGAITITPNSNDFGRSTVGTATGGRTFTVTNTGGSSVGPMVIGVAGTNPTDFPIGSNTCSGTMLTAGGTCTVAVAFNPSATGARDGLLTANGAGASAGGTASLNGIGDTAALIQVTPTAASFGSVATSASLDLPFTVTNAGTAPTGAITAVVTGVAATQFSVVSVGTCSAPLAGGASCTVTVRYSPTMLGAVVAVLDVSSPTGGRDTSDLSATGITPAALEFTAGTPVTFGNVAETDTPTRTVTVRNAGAATVTGLTAAISGADMGSFSILSTTCGATLATTASCNYVIQMAAHSARGYSAQLDVSGATGGMINAPISATGIADLGITCAPDLAFGNATINGTPIARTCTVLNQTARALTLNGLPTVTGADFAATFPGAGACTASSALAAGTGSCTMLVTFAATGTAGMRSAMVNARANPGGATDTVTVTGTALAPLRFTSWRVILPAPGGSSPSTTAMFPTTTIGSTSEIELTYTNSSLSPVTTINYTATMMRDLNIVGGTCAGQVPASTTCTVIVRFYPQAPAAATSGTVRLDYGTNNSGTVTLNATGSVGPTISISGTAAFGNVIATRSASQTFTVTNASPTLATGVLSYGLTGSTDFTIAAGAAGGTCNTLVGGVIPAGGTCTIIVVFAPVISDRTDIDQTTTLNLSQPGQVVPGTTLTGRATSQITVTPTGPVTFTTGAGTTTTTPTRFTVTNVGAATTASITVGIGNGASTANFPIVGATNTCGGAILAPAATCVVDVNFTSFGADVTGDLQIANGGFVAGNPIARQATARLDGRSRSQASLRMSVATMPSFFNRLYFGFVIEGSQSQTYTFTVTNDGDLPATGMAVNLGNNFCTSGDIGFGINPATQCNQSLFTILSNTCTGTLNGGASCTFQARFNPTAGTAFGTAEGKYASVRASGMDGTGATVTAEGYMAGVACTGSIPTISPSPVDFGVVAGGMSSATRMFTFANNSASPITVSSVVMYNGNTHFTISGGTCGVVPAGMTCSFNVAYTPAAAAPYGAELGYIQVNHSGFGGATFAGVVGTSQAPASITVTPSSFAYPGLTGVGATVPNTFTVDNNGDVATVGAPTITISGPDSGMFTLGTNNCTGSIPAHGSCTFVANYHPLAAGLGHSATVTVNGGAAGSPTVSLSGNATGSAALGFIPSAPQTCPTHYANTSQLCSTINVQNLGLSNATLTFAITNDFSIDPLSPCVLAGVLPIVSQCAVLVRHNPTDIGNDVATLTVGATEPGVPSIMTTISSSGVAALESNLAATPGAAQSYAFPNTTVMSSAASPSIIFTNHATTATAPLRYTLTGATFDVESDSCSGRVLNPGDTCAMSVRFVPTSMTSFTGSLTLTDGTGSGATAIKTATVTFSGTGT